MENEEKGGFTRKGKNQGKWDHEMMRYKIIFSAVLSIYIPAVEIVSVVVIVKLVATVNIKDIINVAVCITRE